MASFGTVSWIATIACVLIASNASAAVLALDVDVDFLFRGRGSFGGPALVVPLDGLESQAASPVLVSSGTGGFTLQGGAVSGTAVAPTDIFIGLGVLSGASFTGANRAGVLQQGGGPGGGFGGSFGFDGALHIFQVLLDITLPGAVIGEGGVGSWGAANLMVTVTGHAWTTGTASVTGISAETASGAFAGTLTLGGFDTRTADHRGSVQLVTPMRVSGLALIAPAGGFGITTLTFVPEAGPTALLALAALAGVWFGRRRRH